MAKRRRKEKWEQKIAAGVDAIIDFFGSLGKFFDWVADKFVQAEQTMRIRRDYVVILVIILALILLAFAIPMLDALMREVP